MEARHNSNTRFTARDGLANFVSISHHERTTRSSNDHTVKRRIACAVHKNHGAKSRLAQWLPKYLQMDYATTCGRTRDITQGDARHRSHRSM